MIVLLVPPPRCQAPAATGLVRAGGSRCGPRLVKLLTKRAVPCFQVMGLLHHGNGGL